MARWNESLPAEFVLGQAEIGKAAAEDGEAVQRGGVEADLRRGADVEPLLGDIVGKTGQGEKMKRLLCLLCLLFLEIAGTQLYAQVIIGSVTGCVVDPTGGIVPSAVVNHRQ